MNSITVIEHHKVLDPFNLKKDIPIVALIFKDGTKKTYHIGERIRGLTHNGARPVGVEWYGDSKWYIPTADDVEWICDELRYVFDASLQFDGVIKGLINE